MNEEAKLQKEIYSPQKLMQYMLAVSVAEKLHGGGHITGHDKRKIITALNKNYGFKEGSIFAV